MLVVSSVLPHHVNLPNPNFSTCVLPDSFSQQASGVFLKPSLNYQFAILASEDAVPFLNLSCPFFGSRLLRGEGVLRQLFRAT